MTDKDNYQAEGDGVWYPLILLSQHCADGQTYTYTKLFCLTEKQGITASPAAQRHNTGQVSMQLIIYTLITVMLDKVSSYTPRLQ